MRACLLSLQHQCVKAPFWKRQTASQCRVRLIQRKMAATLEALTLTQDANTLGVYDDNVRPAKLICSLLDGQHCLPVLVATPSRQLKHVLISDTSFVMLCSVHGARSMLNDLVLAASTPPPAADAVDSTQLGVIIDACS